MAGMNLKQTLDNIHPIKIVGGTNLNIQEIVFDSRRVKTADLFVAVVGTLTDGHQYIESALAKGAIAVVCQEMPHTLLENITYILVDNSTKALGVIAANFYGNPSLYLKLVGITGTNGKTTVATLLHQLFTKLGYKTGLLSTIENKVGHAVIPSTHTTPDSVQLNALLAKMLDEGCDFVFMEVSSHAISQNRIAGLNFSGGVFTNISHDHLDYHKTFSNYITAKKAFFDQLSPDAFALTNIDDKRGTVMVQNSAAKMYTYSLKRPATYKAKILENNWMGLHLEINRTDVFAQLIGGFNAYNLLAVYAVAILFNQDETQVLTEISALEAVEGRFEYLVNPVKNIVGIVDYAHTPDALEKVLKTIRSVAKGGKSVITVVGCGGDRDQKKRPLIAKIACDYSEQVIITSDNPRSERPERIVEEMEVGIPAHATNKVLTIVDRKQAILTACRLAEEGDIVLVAGKGHEKYQEINGIKYPFDDKEIIESEFTSN